ncbi:LCP family protein [Peribacillus sp. NPDC096540]|uniref:LCP family glycopolymer transferase n=1 Tax=Peribacillus sp. NPDC096540 TaxID=3390612 RepID=UPI003CFEA556
MSTGKRKKILLIILTTIIILILGGGSFTYYLWSMVTSTVASIQVKYESKERLEKINIKEGDPISVLLMGIDDPADRELHGRSDALILLTINPHSQSMHVVSIPRDTYTKIIGKGTKDKINHSHALGGDGMTIRTVEKFLDIPVDYFIKGDMKSFVDIVDAVGGVKVDNDLDFTIYGVHYPTGTINLNGKEALGYSRMRKDDPRGDFGRQLRQRQVIEAVINKGSHISSITKFDDIFKVVENNVKTNLTFNDMWAIQSNYKESLQNIVQHQIDGKDSEMNKIYYFIPDKEKVGEISDELKKHLEIDKQ